MSGLVVGIGELLWDILPGKRVLGGAPGNFAWHVHSLGLQAAVVSAVGDDEDGREALARMGALGLSTDHVRVDPVHATGRSTVGVNAEGVPVFDVHENAAWDHIRMSSGLERIAETVDAVFFGTLGQRCMVSRESTRAFLDLLRPDAIKLFDLNLRPPWFSDDVIEHGLETSTVVKLSDDELETVSRIAGLDGCAEDRIAALVGQYDLRAAALTRGPKGSVVCVDGEVSVQPAVRCDVVDTVGAGDAFAAVLIVGLLEGWELDRLSSHANRVASFVCSRPGATPVLPRELACPPG